MTVVGDLLELRYGKALKADDRDGGDVPVVGSGGIVGGHSSGITPGPTIVVGRKGSIGTVTWIDGPAWPIDTAYFVNLKRSDVDFRWVYWLLASLKLASMNRSAAVPGLNRDDVYRLSVHLPKLEDQRRIAAILDHAESTLAKRREVVARFEALIQSLFTSIIPRELPRVALGEFAEVRLGKMLDSRRQGRHGEHRRKYLRNANVQWFHFDLDDVYEMDFHPAEREKYALRFGDVLVCEGGQPGRCAVWRSEIQECYFQKALHRVRLGPDVLPDYFARAMHRLVETNSLKDYVTSATIAHLTGEKIRNLPVPMAPLSLQRQFVNGASRIEGVRAQAQSLMEKDLSLFKSLQARAFRGEL